MFIPVSVVATDLCSEAVPIQLLEIRGNNFFSCVFLALLLLSSCGKTCGCLLCYLCCWMLESCSVQLLSVLPPWHHGLSLVKVSSLENLLWKQRVH